MSSFMKFLVAICLVAMVGLTACNSCCDPCAAARTSPCCVRLDDPREVDVPFRRFKIINKTAETVKMTHTVASTSAAATGSAAVPTPLGTDILPASDSAPLASLITPASTANNVLSVTLTIQTDSHSDSQPRTWTVLPISKKITEVEFTYKGFMPTNPTNPNVGTYTVDVAIWYESATGIDALYLIPNQTL